MRLSGLPGQLRDSLLGLAGTQLVENWLEDIWQATSEIARHLTRPAQRIETDINPEFFIGEVRCVHI